MVQTEKPTWMYYKLSWTRREHWCEKADFIRLQSNPWSEIIWRKFKLRLTSLSLGHCGVPSRTCSSRLGLPPPAARNEEPEDPFNDAFDVGDAVAPLADDEALSPGVKFGHIAEVLLTFSWKILIRNWQSWYGWHGSQYVCHATEVRTGGFCLCLLGYNPDFWVVPALLSAADMPAV